MPNWLALIIVGVVIYAFAATPVFPAEWSPAARILAGLLVVVGLLILVLGLLGVAL